MLTVFSFYVDRRADYPEAVDYIPLLKALDRSCDRLGISHNVLTDFKTLDCVLDDADCVASPFHLPRNLTRASTAAHALCLEHPLPGQGDTLFVGADCLIRKEFRDHVPEGDFAVAFRPENKRHRLNNGFIYVPAASVSKVAPLFRRIADNTGLQMCDDLVALEQALWPMPAACGLHERAGLMVNFVPMMPWQGVPDAVEDPIEDAFVLHFRGQRRKKLMLDWAAKWLA